MKGGDIQYIVANHDYGSGFDEMIMDSSLVHLMFFVNHDSLPLGLDHDSRAMYLSFGGFVVFLYTKVLSWMRPHACEGKPT